MLIKLYPHLFFFQLEKIHNDNNLHFNRSKTSISVNITDYLDDTASVVFSIGQ